ncbi:MAG: hypothetical protein AAF191_11155 [Verrucomicrobiota bacterium]
MIGKITSTEQESGIGAVIYRLPMKERDAIGVITASPQGVTYKVDRDDLDVVDLYRVPVLSDATASEIEELKNTFRREYES